MAFVLAQEHVCKVYCYAGTSLDADADRYCRRLTGPVHENIISVNIHTITTHAHHIHHTCIRYTYHIHTELCMILHLPFSGAFQLVPSWLVSIGLFRYSVARTWRLCFLDWLDFGIGLLSCLCLRQLHKMLPIASILCSVCRGDNV